MTECRTNARASTFAVLLAMALVVLDAGFVNVALPTISKSLQVEPARVISIVSAYQAAILVGLLPCAHIAGRFGPRRLFIGGLAMFSIASVACAFATNLPMLIVARVAQGLGGSAIMALGIALLRLVFGAEGLGKAIGWNAMTVAVSSAIAPLLGALTLSLAPWPMLFLIKLPICALALVAARALTEDKTSKSPIDTLSIGLHASVATLVFVGVTLASSEPNLAILFAGIATALGIVLIKRVRARLNPLWPLDLLALVLSV